MCIRYLGCLLIILLMRDVFMYLDTLQECLCCLCPHASANTLFARVCVCMSDIMAGTEEGSVCLLNIAIIL